MAELRVYGLVRWEDGDLAPGVKVSVYDKDLRHQDFLGESITNDAGRYEIKYRTERFRQSEEKNADLIFRLSNSEGISLTLSVIIFNDQSLNSFAVIFNAPAEAQIDLIVEPENKELSEYERYVSELAPVMENIPLADLTETDVEFLSGETDLPKQHVNSLITAYGHAAVTGVEPVTFYGLLRQGLPTELSALLAQGTEVQRDALKRSCAENIIPNYLCVKLDDILEQLQTLHKGTGS